MKTTLILILAAGAANADPVIWDNGGPTGFFTASQDDTAYPFDAQAADDFVLADDMYVTDVHWHGGYWGGSPVEPIAFNILIYADDGTGLAPTQPGTEIYGAYGVSPNYAADPNYANGFFYDIDLASPFMAQAGVQYWIGIQAVVNFPPQWGWTSTFDGNHGATTVQGFPLLGIPYWTTLTEDMSFQLTGIPVPAPTSMALLGLGALIRRR
jgi:hypothetical protein